MTRRRPALEPELPPSEPEPWNPVEALGIAHAGKWARVTTTDGVDEVRCAEHGLRPDQH